jgi:phosphomevalonate kinase
VFIASEKKSTVKIVKKYLNKVKKNNRKKREQEQEDEIMLVLNIKRPNWWGVLFIF